MWEKISLLSEAAGELRRTPYGYVARGGSRCRNARGGRQFHGQASAHSLIILIIWEILGRFRLVADGALPPPSAVLLRLVDDWADYPNHIAATLEGAGAGFVIGKHRHCGGCPVCVIPGDGAGGAASNIALFALPPIAISPILVLTFSGMTPRIVLAAIGCYFVTMTATVSA